MWWAALAAFSGAFGQGLNQRQQIKAQNRIAKANAEATNITRAGNAQLASAIGNLNRWKQSVGNQRVLKQAALEQSALKTNLLRMRKDAKEADLETRLAAASEAGSMAAAFGAAGVGGGTRDMINSTLRISEGRKLDQLKQQKDAYTYDALRQLTNMQEDVAYRLDDSMVIDQIDYRTAHAEKNKVPSVWRTMFNSAMSAASSSSGQAALSNVGGGGSDSAGQASSTSFFSQAYGSSSGNRNFSI